FSTEVYAATRPAIADLATTRIDEAALFGLVDPTQPLAFPFGGRRLDLLKSDASGGFWTLFAHADDPPVARTFFQDTAPPLATDLGPYRAHLGVKRADGNLANLFLGTTADSSTALMLNYDQPLPDPAPPVTAQVLFRFFPEGTPIGELREGEVAIFQQCNYGGSA